MENTATTFLDVIVPLACMGFAFVFYGRLRARLSLFNMRKVQKMYEAEKTLEAIEYLENMRGEWSLVPRYWFLLAFGYAKMGDDPRAHDALDRALKLSPQDKNSLDLREQLTPREEIETS